MEALDMMATVYTGQPALAYLAAQAYTYQNADTRVSQAAGRPSPDNSRDIDCYTGVIRRRTPVWRRKIDWYLLVQRAL